LNINLVSACQGGEWTIVGGRVLGPDGKSVRNADVTVVCYHNSEENELKTKSRSGGFYRACYKGEKCDEGDYVEVYAEKSGIGSGYNSGIVKDFIDTRRVDIDIVMLNITIPEFSLMTGLITFLLAMLVFFVVRKD